MRKRRTRTKELNDRRRDDSVELPRTTPVVEVTSYEKSLIELVHFLAYGNKLEFGFTLEDTISFLTRPIPHKQNKTALLLVKENGSEFIKELKQFLEDRS
jgi:hypothetical protein